MDLKKYITKREYAELQRLGEKHGIDNEDQLFEIIRGLSYQEARNAIIGWVTCQGVA